MLSVLARPFGGHRFVRDLCPPIPFEAVPYYSSWPYLRPETCLTSVPPQARPNSSHRLQQHELEVVSVLTPRIRKRCRRPHRPTSPRIARAKAPGDPSQHVIYMAIGQNPKSRTPKKHLNPTTQTGSKITENSQNGIPKTVLTTAINMSPVTSVPLPGRGSAAVPQCHPCPRPETALTRGPSRNR